MSAEARARALTYLEKRMRSEEEVRRDLAAKGYSSRERDDAIAYLYAYGYLDDAAYVGAFIRDKLRFSPQGPSKIRQSLLQRGLEGQVIEDALALEYPEDRVREVAMALGAKHRDKGKTKIQTMRYLYSRGFSEGLIYDLVEDLYRQV